MLHNDRTLAERSTIQVDDMELLEVCWRTTYFQVSDKFLQQKDGMAVGSSLSAVVSNIYIALPVNVEQAAMRKQADHWLCISMNVGTIWEGSFRKIKISIT
jgi:hypothetical protein